MWKYIVAFIVIIFLIAIIVGQNNEESFDDDVEAPYISHGREVWSTLADVGFSVIPDSISSSWLERYCYTTSYNKVTRQPNWVMWQLTGDHVMQRKEGIWNEYREDADLPADDCNWDDKGRDETYVLSNMCPQNPNLNRGDWKEIENACRKWAQKYGSIYIVCGPMFFKSQEHERIGPNQIPIPEAFFKVVLCVDEYAPKGIGFICRNTDGNRTKDFYVNSIRQVERITGYKFFPNLNDSIMNLVYDMDDINVW